jgi:hypothetical protein
LNSFNVHTLPAAGENAAGRFNYEWLFKKAERDRIHAAYEQLADEATGKLSNMDFAKVLYQSDIEVDDKFVQPIRYVIEMHPENAVRKRIPKTRKRIPKMRYNSPMSTSTLTLG